MTGTADSPADNLVQNVLRIVAQYQKDSSTSSAEQSLREEIEQLRATLAAVIAHNDAAVELAHARGVRIHELETELQRFRKELNEWRAHHGAPPLRD